MKLYELTQQYQELIQLAEHTDDEAESQMFRDTLEGIDGEIDQKIQNCAAVVKTIEAIRAAIAAETKRLSMRAVTLENSIDRLKAYMLDAMKLADKKQVKGDLFTVSIQKNPPKVAIEVDDPRTLPSKYHRVKVEADRSLIAADLKAGFEIPGAHLEQTEGLRIR